MSGYECRFFKKRFPDEGEILIGKVATIDSEGVSVDLLEYGDARGLVLLGELSKKRIKNINQITKINNIEVCIVLRVDNQRGYIDLSLARVSEDEKEECKKNYMKNKIAYHIMAKAAKKLNTTVKSLYESFGYDKAEEYGSLYYFFARVKDDESILEDTELGRTIKKLIQDQFQANTYKVRADIDVTCPSVGGISSIKDAFRKAMRDDPKIQITLSKTPTYSITRVSSNKEKAYQSVLDICEKIKKFLEAKGGSVNVISQPKLCGEKSRYALLTTNGSEALENESSDE